VTVSIGRMVLVGLGESHYTKEPGRVVVARPLGSTAALALFDPIAEVGGLVHWMLPNAQIDPDRANRSPDLFADCGILRLVEHLRREGAVLDGLSGVLAGAASMVDAGPFDVGERNREIARSLLDELGIALIRDETGGVSVRELSLEIGPGAFRIRSLNR
jgi:chemotaxis protein CheD